MPFMMNVYWSFRQMMMAFGQKMFKKDFSSYLNQFCDVVLQLCMFFRLRFKKQIEFSIYGYLLQFISVCRMAYHLHQTQRLVRLILHVLRDALRLVY